MPNMRGFLLIALIVTGYFLWEAWQQQFSPAPSNTPTSVSTSPETLPSVSATPNDVPSTPINPITPQIANTTEEKSLEVSALAPRIHIKTNVLDLTLDTLGGSLVDAHLPQYPIHPSNKKDSVKLLDDSNEHYFVAQLGLVSSSGAAPDHRAVFQAKKNEYTMGDGDTLEVPLTWVDSSGLQVTRIYQFKRDSYVFSIHTEINNQSPASWSGSEYRQMQRTSPLVNRAFSFTNPEQYSFVGASWYSPENKYEKLAFDDFSEQALNRTFQGGWAALQQHYFFAAWIPPAQENTQYSTQVISSNATPRYLIRAMAPTTTIASGAKGFFESRFYVGPKLQDHLAEIAPGLAYTVDYGKVTFAAQPLFWLLKWLHQLTNNWGFAIIFLTLLIKLAFFKLTEAQYKSFAKMRKLSPRMQALKERYGEDKQKLNQAMMELYQKEKINPLGGCLPMLVQIPVFIALYWVLLESVELRQAPFIGWIQNLSDKDPYFILPILNGLAMIASQRLTPTVGMDPMQAKVMQIMPIIFSISFAFFPAGLVLYWTVNGTLSLAQQWIITQRIQANDKA
jgi:YidC/Oxa1 family membrane protein insertase